jgi:hypothetical protein
MSFLNDVSLDKAIKYDLGINNAFCTTCKKERPLKEPQFRIARNNILAYDECYFCQKEIHTVCDYKTLTLFNKLFHWAKLEDKCFLLRKGVYPYEWVNTYDKFHSKLTGKSISDKEYKFATQLWNHFNLKNFGKYHDLYLKLGTILLYNVFTNRRKMCYKYYKLDPVYYISAPHLANNASLKTTKEQIELYTDQDMYELMKAGIRGGISMVSNSYALANNCYFYDQKSDKVVKLSKEKAKEKGIYNSKKAY